MKPQYICGLALWGTVGIFIGASVLAQKLAPNLIGPPIHIPTSTNSVGTNWVDLETLTNMAFFTAPVPPKVTIWFQYQWDNHFEFYPAALGSITTNVWSVTVSNATEMVKAHLKSQGSEWKFITLTGIWRDE